MSGSSRQLTARKAILVVLGVGLFASASLGGYTLWTRSGGEPIVDDAPAIVPVQPTPSVLAKAPAIAEPAVDAVTPPPVVQTSASVELEVRKKEPPQGKSHERQGALLATMAQILHDEAYRRFISQPGMGMSRMVPTISVMPREWKVPEWTSEELARMKPPEGDAKDLGLLHRLSLTGFGASNTKTEEERWTLMYNESRGKDMKKDHLWEIKSLDLVGLVMHETPTVYVSAQIPAMKDLKKRPTREMDVFEMEGLEDLVSGKPLYIRSKDETLRVLGPITAAKACLKCHGDAKEGDMLGAFSYTLRRAQYVVNGRGLSGQPLGEGFVAPPMKGPGYPVTPKK